MDGTIQDWIVGWNKKRPEAITLHKGALIKEPEDALHGLHGIDRSTRFWFSLSCFGGYQ
jgi:hypothetical protein